MCWFVVRVMYQPSQTWTIIIINIINIIIIEFEMHPLLSCLLYTRFLTTSRVFRKKLTIAISTTATTTTTTSAIRSWKIHPMQSSPQQTAQLSATSTSLVEEDTDDNDDDNFNKKNDDQSFFYDLEEYLKRCIDTLDHSYEMNINESHRKPMISTLMGLTKVDLDQKLRDEQLRLFWERTKEFFANNSQLVQPITESDEDNNKVEDGDKENKLDLTLAPYYVEGLQKMDTFETSPQRLFTYLARGRHYQGKFHLLLEDIAPELVSTYWNYVRKDASDIELFQRIAERYGADTDLLRCIEMNFIPDPIIQPEDGGQRKGKRGEFDLTTYLHQYREFADNEVEKCIDKDNDISNDRIRRRRRILPNVLAKPTTLYHKTINEMIQKRKKAGSNNLLFTDAVAKRTGITGEFDALVIDFQHKENDNVVKTGEDNDIRPSIRIVEVWEAKATLHPVTLQDILIKKIPSMIGILKDSNAKLLFASSNDGKEKIDDNTYMISSCHYQEDGITPKFGIFCTDILPPDIAARRLQISSCENRLRSEKEAVIEALDSGTVKVPDVTSGLKDLLKIVQRLKPIVVVSSLRST